MKTITKTNTTSLSFSDIADIIDEHLADEVNLLFVCNRILAEAICDYVLTEYNLIDEDMELSDDIKEYYVSLYFNDDEINFYCETATGINREYKMYYIDEYIDYYICVNMNTNVAFDKLLGEEGSWNWVNVDMDDYIVEKYDEEELENKGIEYDELLDLYTEKIKNTQGCPGCIREVLDELGSIFISTIDYCCDEKDYCDEDDEEKIDN